MSTRQDLRTIAIIAHVDHGKTTLVDALFRQGGMFRENQVVADCLMDQSDQERERGITILAKATSVRFGDVTLQLVDTPGHADFGGEVERSLHMVDGVLLLVDAAEGPLPQTRFVLRKAMERKLPAVIVINKIDRADARPQAVLDEVYDLFLALGAGDEVLDLPVLYTSARSGTATTDLAVPGVNLRPLVDAILRTVPPPEDTSDKPFLLQVNRLGYDDYVGRLVIGRILAGQIRAGQNVRVGGPARDQQVRVVGVYTYRGVQRLDLEQAIAGDIVALAGVEEVDIGDTLSAPEAPRQLPPVVIDEPTVAMVFQVNDGPLAGRSGGRFVTSRHLRERLRREAYANVSIRIEDGETPDRFRVMARGELQLAVLIEAMRREGYELCVRTPQVITRQGAHGLEEPLERLVVDVPVEHIGAVSELLGPRRARLEEQRYEGDRVRMEYTIPTRGTLGLRGNLLTQTRGTALVFNLFEGWTPWQGPIAQRATGAIVADRNGSTTTYALFHLQPRGIMFVGVGAVIYRGMIIGEHNRENDLWVYAAREKKLTNMRAAGHDEKQILAAPREMTLERCLEWIRDDEMVEVTPHGIRMRKVDLNGSGKPSEDL